RNVFTGLNIIILLFITKTADNPSFPRQLALWSDGFCNKSHNKRTNNVYYLSRRTMASKKSSIKKE
ncbi:hypothetical protein, partial [Escherichia coli]|uniref:hypothetical protein n=1 Tax=Escherichia coli TaxID=562 RepID=UPI001CCC11BD